MEATAALDQIESVEGDHTESYKYDSRKEKSSKWWWYIIFFDSDQEAIDWNPPTVPKIKYMGWRAHAAPTTGKPHVHVLAYYCSVVRYKNLVNKKYCHVRWLDGTVEKVRCRNYLRTDVHKDGSPKNPIGPHMEVGLWPEGLDKQGRRKLGNQGDREDLITVRDKVRAHKRKADVYKDDDLVEAIAKFPKFVNDMWNTREGAPPEVDMSMGIQPWQKELLAILEQKPKTRQVIWVWSEESNTGKNVFMNYLYYVEQKNILAAPPKYTDLLHMYDGQEIIWFDCTRATDDVDFSAKKFKQILLKNIEHCSNHGPKPSPKYEGMMKNMVAHVVVTSNMPPPYEDLPNRLKVILATPLVQQPTSEAQPSAGGQDGSINNRDQGLPPSPKGAGGQDGDSYPPTPIYVSPPPSPKNLSTYDIDDEETISLSDH